MRQPLAIHVGATAKFVLRFGDLPGGASTCYAAPVARADGRRIGDQGETGELSEMASNVPDANEARGTIGTRSPGPRWFASPGFRERRNQESLALCWSICGDRRESVLEIGCGTAR